MTILFSEGTEDDGKLKPEAEEAVSKAFAEVAVDGEVAASLLPIVLASANLRVDAATVEEAIRKFALMADDANSGVTLGQALAISQYLAGLGEPRPPSATTSTAGKTASEPSSLRKLQVTVICVMFLSASIAAGLAILWLWLNTTSQNEHYAQIELDLNADMLDVMVHQNFQRQKAKLAEEFAQTIGTLVMDLGYGLSSEMGKAGLFFAVNVLARVIDEWWQREGMLVVQDTTAMLKTWVGLLFARIGVNRTARLMGLLNNRTMPPGAEIIMGQWSNGNNSAIRYLFPPRFTDQCLSGGCNSVPGSGRPMRMALWGYSGVMRANDYRPKMVQAGYTYFPDQQVGMVFKVDLSLVYSVFGDTLKTVFDTLNAQSTTSKEIMVARNLSDGTPQMLTTLRYRRSVRPGGLFGDTPLGRAMRNQVGMTEAIDYDGERVLAAYAGVPSAGLGLVLKVDVADFSNAILVTLGKVLRAVNSELPGSSEVELASFRTDPAGNQVLTNLTAYRFDGQCAGPCNVSSYIQASAGTCSSGVTNGVDYRGVDVIAGYTCLPQLNAIATFKVDRKEVWEQGLEQAVQAADQMNQNEVSSSFEMLMGLSKNLSRHVKTDADVAILTKLKSACKGSCDGTVQGLVKAFQRYEGILYGTDYRGVDVMAAVKYVDSMFVGLEAKVDMSELMAPIVSKALVIMGITLGCLAGSTVLLALYTNTMVRAMVRAEQEGQEAIVVEKQRFSSLVASMYPAYVVPRLLAGERSIVQSLPHTAVFFSDIYDFTSTANKITSEELLDLMGYTYGVMDQVADHFCVTKVKTVGDAYLAISGLPGPQGRNCTLDMLRFASCVTQVFSCKFDHPSRGDVLALLQTHSTKPAGNFAKPRRGGSVSVAAAAAAATAEEGAAMQHSLAPRGRVTPSPSSNGLSTKSDPASRPGHKDPYAKVPKVRCLMSYGIAAGPVTAGVLQGKNPMFDIWGKTVNLASRMQSTSPPGRIQVTDLFCHAILAVPGQPFTFDDSHEVMC
eukprot:EG_transcript_1451